MIHDLALRWIVTLLFGFSAGVCISAIARNRHSAANLVSHSLHAIMAIAMAVMAWPRGAELPTRPPMIFFFAAAVWFAVVTVRTSAHRVANTYHTLMMLAMAWMYAAMGGLPLRGADSESMPEMDMAGMGGGHAGHGGHSGHSAGMHPASESATWVGTVNWLCTIGFAAATAYWLYRFVTARVKPSEDSSSVGILCQLAMAAGMAIMFAVML
ncbi:MAG: DUF5134 domain-containing protein [Mycobacterium sp.]|nr:DUF5134 domain-containing protein [Mycobacterium sp.]